MTENLSTRREFLGRALILSVAFKLGVPASTSGDASSSYGTGIYGIATYQRRRPHKRLMLGA